MSAPGPYRLSAASQDERVDFSFDGRTLHGIRGDTVASALLANGVRIVSRSFKFHRPRGIFSAGYEEPNAILQLHTGSQVITGERAPLVPLSPGLQVSSRIGWPSRSFDLLRAIDYVHPLFAAGFYNKTFIWPSWHVYEGWIRKLAGLGQAPSGPDPDHYDTCHAHCDVLVIGGGEAGLAAAVSAASAGQRVLLVEQRDELGTYTERLRAPAQVTVLTGTMAVAYYDHDLVALTQKVSPTLSAERTNKALPRERLWLVRAARVILATGAIEQPMIFCNNDRPGIMLAGAARQYLRRHAVAPGREVVIATNNDTAYPVARELREAGVNVTALIDARAEAPSHLTAELRALRVPIHFSTMPVDTHGFSGLKSASVGTLNERAQVTAVRKLPCDALLVSGGWSPALHLFAQAGGKLSFSEVTRTFQPVAPHPSIEIVGDAATPPSGVGAIRVSPVGSAARQWIDLRHDVTVADIELSVRENFVAVEHIKRYTTLGMSLDQGKVGQAPATEVIAKARGVAPSQLAHTTFRPPFVPVTLGTMVGRNVGDFYAPTRRTTLHTIQAEAGALFDDFGNWKRAAAFPRCGETRDAAVHREIKLVRGGVGLYDASPLGKIELVGPDALDFADRFYINNLKTLKPGRVRYGIMLRESGVIFDDGTVTVLDGDRILLTTTSAGAGRVAQWLEEWRQCEWPDSRVVVVPVAEQWATLALTGQHARKILERLRPECSIANEDFPHLDFRKTRLLGSEARIYRVSFSGELTYEINVNSHRAPALWAALMEEGREFGIGPYGVDALLQLRMEKGFLHLGADTDGTTVPDDVGFGKPAAAKQRHYVGKRSLSLPEYVRSDRLQLVGLRGVGSAGIPIGSHLRLPGSDQATDGWVTSAGLCSTDGAPVALALLRAGRQQTDKVTTVYDAGCVVTTARVVSPVFYDQPGTRMNA
jgi:sarcosine oxidase subunit alpha